MKKNRIHIANNKSKEIGERVKFLRTSLSLTQKKLGEMALLSPNHISNIENGIENCSEDAVSRLAEALSTSYTYLYNGDEIALRKLEKKKEKRKKSATQCAGQLCLADLGIF